jgi:hypothetical protein
MKTFKEYIAEEKDSSIDEVTSIATRLKRKQNIRKYKSKLKLGRLRASKRTASQDVLKKRANRAARTMMFKKLVKGKSKGDLSYSARGSYEKMVNRRAGAIKAIAKRLVPKARKAEMDRKKGKRGRIIPGTK